MTDALRTTYDFLVIGACAAGVAAAEAIKRTQPEATVLMVSSEAHEPYGRPLISYLIEGKTTEDRIALRDAGAFEQQGIDTGFGPGFTVVSLDATAHEAVLASGSRIGYGACLMATGSVPFVPETPGIEGAANVHGFLTLQDANDTAADAKEATRLAHEAGRESCIVVSGGGLTGMKAAEALSYHADRVLVVGHNRRLLKNALDDGGTAVLKRLIESAHNVECRTGCAVDAAIRDGERVTAVCLSDGTTVPCDVLVMAVGVRPATALAKAAGAQVDRGIVVDGFMRTTLPDVYAAGDCIQITNALTGQPQVMALWGNAVRQGTVAGLAMAGAPDVEPYEADYAENAVDFFGISLLSCGIVNPGPDDGCEDIVRDDDATYAKFVVREGMLAGYVLINLPDRAGIYNAMIRNRIPLSSVADDMLDRPPCIVDLSPDLRKRCIEEGSWQ